MVKPSKHDAVKSSVSPERNTIGYEANRLASEPDQKIEGLELAKEATKTYSTHLHASAKEFPGNDGKTPFYIQVIQTKDSRLVNVLRRRFLCRHTVPAPTPSTTCFKYFPLSSESKLLWALPNEQAINWFMKNWNSLPLDYLPVKEQIRRYLSGELHELIMREDPSLVPLVKGKANFPSFNEAQTST